MSVDGHCFYLYRAVDKLGQTIDFYLSPRRNFKAAKTFLGKALKGLKCWEQPTSINTDKHSSYARAIKELKAEGQCSPDLIHRQVKYLNNIIEGDHSRIKRVIRPMNGFKSRKTAYATIKGIETMHALRKGQAKMFYKNDPLGEVRLVERAFGLMAA